MPSKPVQNPDTLMGWIDLIMRQTGNPSSFSSKEDYFLKLLDIQAKHTSKMTQEFGRRVAKIFLNSAVAHFGERWHRHFIAYEVMMGRIFELAPDQRAINLT